MAHCALAVAAVVGSSVRASAADAPPRATPPLFAATSIIPFDFSQGVIVLDLDLGGTRPVKVVFDTGDADCLLDLEAARAIGLPLEMSDLHGAGSGDGAVTFYQMTPRQARLGGKDFEVPPFIVMPVAKNFESDSGIRCEGSLGYDFFKGRVVEIDFPSRTLKLLAPAPAPPSGGQPIAEARLPIQWVKYDADSPLTMTTDQLKVGTHAIRAQVDTCFSGALILFASKLPWLKSTPVTPPQEFHYENANLPAGTLIDAVAFGSVQFKGSPTANIAGVDAHIPETDIAAILGCGFFKDAKLTIDFGADRMIVRWDKAP